MVEIRAIRELEPWTGADLVATLVVAAVVLAALTWAILRFGRS